MRKYFVKSKFDINLDKIFLFCHKKAIKDGMRPTFLINVSGPETHWHFTIINAKAIFCNGAKNFLKADSYQLKYNFDIIDFEILALFDSSPLYQFSKFNNFL